MPHDLSASHAGRRQKGGAPSRCPSRASQKDARDGDPFLSPEDSRLFFWSNRPFPGKTTQDTELWVAERRADGWSEPRRLDPPVNNEVNEPFPAVAADGTLYFGTVRPGSGARPTRRSWCSAAIGRAVTGRSICTSAGGRTAAGRQPATSVPAVNGPDHEFCPQVVAGGRLLLFSRDTPEGGVFQIDAAVLDDPAAP